MNCELISVGTEILLGDIVNTDAQFLSRELAALGIDVLYTDVVGDNRERLTDTLRRALSRSDIVILSGGLGPTKDDLTKEVCCETMGVPLREDARALAWIEEYFRRRGTPMADINRKQALVPEGGVVFYNSRGTAPGCAVERDGKCVILLPGPPRELNPMFIEGVRPYLLEKYAHGAIVSRSVRTFGIGESAMAAQVSDLLDRKNPTVAPYAKSGEALLRVTAKADSREQAGAMCDQVVGEIRDRLGSLIYGVDTPGLECTAVELLKKSGKKLALAESCTAGYIAKRITEVPGASEVFECGIVSYANKIKEKLLGVSEQTLAKQGAVCADVARQMAEGVLRLSGADIAVSVTGIAGPDPSEGGKPAGLSYLALTDGTHTYIRKVTTGHAGEGSREYNRYVSSSNALDMVRLYLQGHLDQIGNL